MWEAEHPSLPTIVFDHVGQLYDVLALLVLLTGLKGVLLQNHQQHHFSASCVSKSVLHTVGHKGRAGRVV